MQLLQTRVDIHLVVVLRCVLTFPVWNLAGVIPPIRPGLDGTNSDRSPYKTDILGFIDYFCTSAARADILEGFLEYRNLMHTVGMTKGFQWLNGSFSEDIETNEARDPNDIDVVTFYETPSGGIASLTTQPRFSEVANLPEIKKNYKVDAYYNQLSVVLGVNEVERISYWYSMWSHRRDGLWKGFVQVDLDPAIDHLAKHRITELRQNLSCP